MPSEAGPLGVDHPDWILYREDLHSNAVDNGSLAENLHADIMGQSKLQTGGQLGIKLGFKSTNNPPSSETLALFKTVATRYIRLGSLHPTKTPGRFFTRLLERLQSVEDAVL